MKRVSILGAVLLMLVCTAAVDAAKVTFSLNVSPTGEFSVFALATPTDNRGIVAFGVPLTGGITSINNLSPNVTAGDPLPFPPFFQALGLTGFPLLRSADIANQPPGPHILRGSQDTVGSFGPFNPIFGFGQRGGDLGVETQAIFPDADFLFSTDNAADPNLGFGVPLLLATGTWEGVEPRINTTSGEFAVNVFRADADEANPATMMADAVVPEPASAGLFVGLGTLLIARRRRLA